MSSFSDFGSMDTNKSDILSDDNLNQQMKLRICSYAIREHPYKGKKPPKKTKELAYTLLEAFGYIPVSEDLPLACGHLRDTDPDDKLYRRDLCVKCTREKEREKNKR